MIPGRSVPFAPGPLRPGAGLGLGVVRDRMTALPWAGAIEARPQDAPLGHAGVETAAAGLLPVLHLLVVDEDHAVRNACMAIAKTMRLAVVGASDLEAAREILKHQRVDLLLLDLKVTRERPSEGKMRHGRMVAKPITRYRVEEDGGLSLLEEVKRLTPETSVIVMTAFATVASAVEAMRIGAGDYLTKPFALEELVVVLERAGERKQLDIESRRVRERMRKQKATGHLIGGSPEMEKLYRILSKVAQTQHPVLILGESGTGKELMARSIHFNGPTAHKPFIPVDCASLVPDLIEGELFGYAAGMAQNEGLRAGTRAVQAKDGLLALPGGGTIFLEEISELSLELQMKLLRALQERTISPLGSMQEVPVTTRVLAGSSCDLAALVEQGRFRRDLYFRLNVVSLRIPPLRDRKDDLPVLAQHFLDRCQRGTGATHAFSDDALRAMMRYEWPGNVGELENAIERACTLSSGPVLHMGDLPTQLQDWRLFGREPRMGAEEREAGIEEEDGADDRIVSMAEVEREAILRTIRVLHGDKLMAAKLLGIGKTTLYRKLKEYGFVDEDGEAQV